MTTDYEDENTIQAHYQAAAARSFQLDEGFVEDTGGFDDADRADSHERLAQEWIMSQPEAVREEIVISILRTLPNSSKGRVVDRIMPLLHMDPAQKLPPEITSQVFGYLNATTLLLAGLASPGWRERALDTRLWSDLFINQGWRVDKGTIKALEAFLIHKNGLQSRKGKSRAISDDISQQPRFKKRVTSGDYDTRRQQKSVDLPNWGEQHSTPEIDSDVQQDNSDHEMLDAPNSFNASPSRANKRQSHDSDDEMDFTPGPSGTTLGQVGHREQSNSAFTPQLTTINEKGEEVINWAYLYKQRHRLEQNWLHGRYTMFQLPDPAYPQEAHTECVYCIQFCGKWLVSGSRDKTLRVWDLETRRLRGRPLMGHSQSVLCLQFDPSPDEDIIISGSSDSSVIIWKFSTGQKLHEIPSAHNESVLNLRFDRRYLVTCSKDKKIKVWNRNELTPDSIDFPRVKASTDAVRAPSYIIDLANMEPSLLEAGLANSSIKPIKAWSHLLTFIGHVAAVNAVQIKGDLIVSASGDRSIKMWNVSNGRLHKSIAGHAKGIACVQFDSRRIVSGSSDNTVRIFDPISGVEVACLTGHANLVRTVQAGFGDVPWQASEDFKEARRQEEKLRQDMDKGGMSDREFSRRLRNGEFGSSRAAFGSQLPPGGGGSNWGKIVSGSYDESIIIWRKNPQNGEWVAGQTLRQGGSRVSRRHARPLPGQFPPAAALPPAPVNVASIAPTALPVTRTSTNESTISTASPSTNLQPAIDTAAIVSQAVSASVAAALGSGLSNVLGLARNFQHVNVPPRSSSGQSLSSSGTFGPSAGGVGGSWHATGAARLEARTHGQGGPRSQRNVEGGFTPGSVHSAVTHTPQSTTAAGSSSTLDSPIAPVTQRQPSLRRPGQQELQEGADQHGQPGPANANNNQRPAAVNVNVNVIANANANANGNGHPIGGSRVFKLQFDARRIVCCSQDSRIVGWDFANEDPDLVETCPFFLGS